MVYTFTVLKPIYPGQDMMQCFYKVLPQRIYHECEMHMESLYINA